MVLTGTDSYAARVQDRPARRGIAEFLLPSLEVAGPGMHWVEVRARSRPRRQSSNDTEQMAQAYVEYAEAAKTAMKPEPAVTTSTAVSTGFLERGYHLGHVTGHRIGMTMIEFLKIGEGVDIDPRENMVLSMHPHAIAANGENCLYMQETWLVTPRAAFRFPTFRCRYSVRSRLESGV